MLGYHIKITVKPFIIIIKNKYFPILEVLEPKSLTYPIKVLDLFKIKIFF